MHPLSGDVTGKELPLHEWAMLVNKKRNTSAASECMRKLMNMKPLLNTRSLQSTRSGLTQTTHLRSSACTSDRELLQRRDRPDLHAETPPVIMSIAANHKSNVLSHGTEQN